MESSQTRLVEYLDLKNEQGATPVRIFRRRGAVLHPMTRTSLLCILLHLHRLITYFLTTLANLKSSTGIYSIEHQITTVTSEATDSSTEAGAVLEPGKR